MGRTRERVWAGLALAVILTAVAGLGSVAPATAAPAGRGQITDYTVTDYKVDLVVAKNGDLQVTETIAVDFSGTPHHGIERYIPDRFRYDQVKKDYDRVTPIDQMQVSGSAGTPIQSTRKADGDNTYVRIGDPNRTISGPHTYVLNYRVRGAINHFADHDELFWNVIGDKWPVGIDQASTTLAMPDPIQKVACYVGATGSQLPCTSAGVLGSQALFKQNGLPPHSNFTVVASIKPGVIVPTPAPIIEARWTFQRAFALRPDTVGPAGAVAVLGIAGVIFVLVRKGRDRQYVGGAAEQSFGNAGGGTERVPLFGRDPIPIEFEPPDHLRPGQVGRLIDEQANTLDVTATIVDLAVRGYLRITEVPKKGLFGHTDWTLTRLANDDGLKRYERTLLTGLFATAGEIELSALKDHFHTTLVNVEDQLYDDTVSQGWFSKRPDKTKSHWKSLGRLLVIAGVGATVALAYFTSYGLLGVGLVLVGAFLWATAGHLPARTAKGHATYRRILGFKQFIDESEKERAQFAERQNLFSEYLPYAVVFGATEKWAKAFQGLAGPDEQLPATSWYVGQHPFTVITFSHAMSSFATTTSGTLASVPASSGSSGFSGGGGGGFGGGGGGAW